MKSDMATKVLERLKTSPIRPLGIAAAVTQLAVSVDANPELGRTVYVLSVDRLVEDWDTGQVRLYFIDGSSLDMVKP